MNMIRIRFTSAGILLLIAHISSAFLGSSRRAPTICTICSTVADGVFEPSDVHDLLVSDLKTADLTLCHGILHSAGVRELQDIVNLTEEQINDMGIDNFDRHSIQRITNELHMHGVVRNTLRQLSSSRDGAFDRKILSRFEVEEPNNFSMQVICADNEVFKGKLFTIAQCEQLNRMSEHYAYSQIGKVNEGWSDQIYTLTAQHMACKSVPGMIPSTRIVMRQLIQELYALFPGIVPGSIVFENDGEPHLVKYNGKAKGTVLHTDNSEYKYITVNAVLSAQEEYTGGGTYITVLDETVRLEQGDMLIHLGDLEHSGADIGSGVRHLLIAFLACKWKDEELNRPILENARDFEGMGC